MKVYVVAGEPSGDLLASGMMRALRRGVPEVEFRGVGGESMTAVGGFRSLFDIAEISVMGIFEVLPRLRLILRRISQTVSDIETFRPDVLVTVDSWGFVSELVTKLRRRGVQVPIIQYVAPQVWAWKKGRARNVARLIDRLMTLLPDEGRWFEPWGLRSDFVGHPVVERVAEAVLDGDAFRKAHAIPVDATVVSVLPGSRHSEVKRLIPKLKESLRRLAVEHKNLFVVVATVPGVEAEVRRGFADLELPMAVVIGENERYNAFSISRLALAKSGTVSLELVAFGVPHLIVYTFGRLTNFMAQRLVSVRFANLINIFADREVIPEFVLARCRPELIAECADRLLRSAEESDSQVIEAQKVMQNFRLPDVLPSDRAAEIVIEMASFRHAPRSTFDQLN